MIIFGAIAPHSPLLVPTIGKEHRELLELTLKAYHELEHSLYLAKPDTLVILSPHAPMYADAFSGNIHDTFRGVLKEFGDHGTTVQAKADFLVLDHLHRALRDEGIPFTLTSQEELDYGFTIPLLFLTPHLPQLKVIPLATSLLGAQAHEEFGRQIHRVFQRENKRIAILASADLSHHANHQAAGGTLPEGQKFDTLVRQAVTQFRPMDLLQADIQMIEKADQCGYKPILTLLGALEGLNGSFRELCYEAPFGVGYFTARFE